MTESKVPLQQLEVDGEPKVKSGAGAFNGFFLDKTKLIILAVVILVLLIIIIVLAAVLGHEQAKNRSDTPDKTRKYKYSQVFKYSGTRRWDFNPISVFKLEEKQKMDEYLNYPSMLSAISLSYSASHCLLQKFLLTHDISLSLKFDRRMAEWSHTFYRERTPMGCSDSKKEKKKRDVEVDRRSLITIKCADRRGEKGMSAT